MALRDWLSQKRDVWVHQGHTPGPLSLCVTIPSWQPDADTTPRQHVRACVEKKVNERGWKPSAVSRKLAFVPNEEGTDWEYISFPALHRRTSPAKRKPAMTDEGEGTAASTDSGGHGGGGHGGGGGGTAKQPQTTTNTYLYGVGSQLATSIVNLFNDRTNFKTRLQTFSAAHRVEIDIAAFEDVTSVDDAVARLGAVVPPELMQQLVVYVELAKMRADQQKMRADQQRMLTLLSGIATNLGATATSAAAECDDGANSAASPSGGAGEPAVLKTEVPALRGPDEQSAPPINHLRHLSAANAGALTADEHLDVEVQHSTSGGAAAGVIGTSAPVSMNIVLDPTTGQNTQHDE